MIPVFDPTRDYRMRRDDYLDAFDRVMSSGKLVLGPETEAFEREFAAYVGSEHAVGVNSGTDAVVLALKALDVQIGDEVIVPAFTAPATAAAVRAVGAVPRFVDVSPQTLTLDPARLEDAINRRTRCLLAVHLYGHPADVESLADVAERHRLSFIEDCAQAHGTWHEGRHVGTTCHIGCFSFYPTKNLGAFGDGGICITDDRQLAERLRSLRFYGFDRERVVQQDGFNSRLDELQAAMLRIKLRTLDAAIARRRELARRYRLRLALADVRPLADDVGHSYHQFVVRTTGRDELLARLTRAGVEFGIHYRKPLHLMPAYRFLGHNVGEFPAAEEAAEQVVSLPMFAELADSEVDRVCEAIA